MSHGLNPRRQRTARECMADGWPVIGGTPSAVTADTVAGYAQAYPGTGGTALPVNCLSPILVGFNTAVSIKNKKKNKPNDGQMFFESDVSERY